MELNELYNQLIAEGCVRFCIEGVGGQRYDDMERLEMKAGQWQINYYERGQVVETLFSSPDKQEAIRFYHDYVMKIHHCHLVVFTRSLSVFNWYKDILESLDIKTMQNDIKEDHDYKYRLFVTNKDIFKVKESFDEIPYFDEDLKKS
ncbi:MULTISPECIES: hypothetical protein [Chryseobacterium]|uniref:hypothetical protein n=1 Tax=Chryseobacterium TaxID=59732 RepID=UPI0012963A62|nr:MULTISPECIES: hypothetical protein [Chryseobacterium]MDR6923632.1 hypothetical protein [Chryseobacterium sp. 2987]